MECIHCRGRMERSSAPFSIDRKGYHLSWDSIPAWVCTQCGEPYFEPTQVDVIQRTLTSLDQETAALLQSGGKTDSAA